MAGRPADRLMAFIAGRQDLSSGVHLTKIILYIIDSMEDDLKLNLELLKSELKTYNNELLNKPYCIILNKIDLLEPNEIEDKKKEIAEQNIIEISALNGQNIDDWLTLLRRV